MLSAFINLLLPASCTACRRQGAWLCSACAARVCLCTQRISGPTSALSGVEAGTVFRPPLSDAVKALKYRHARAVGAELVRYLEAPLGRVSARQPILVPIPLHVSRLRKRGHNQAEILTKLLAKQAGLPWRNALRRTRSTHTQTTLHRQERFANVSGAFEWIGPPPSQAIILIDDVVTTGATFEAAATACRVAGAAEVWGLAVAHRERG